MQKDVELEGMNNKPTIHVDADACPVKDEILHCASLHEIEVCFVASYKNMMNNPEGKWVYVDADKRSGRSLYSKLSKKRVILSLLQILVWLGHCFLKNVYVLSPRGKEYTEENIFMLLDMRYQSAKLRRQGKHTKGPKAFTKEDRACFTNKLMKTLSNFAGN
ncbi:DUF188 domain-containing protein [Peribacillus frigoritolerans]|nr:DUF188 domain-containing protein [Peribacillus frigoritolerans]